MNKNRIEKGDTVKVYFDNVPALHGAIVEHVPKYPGHPWVFINSEGGKTVYVDNYTRMDLLWKYDPDKTSIPIKG